MTDPQPFGPTLPMFPDRGDCTPVREPGRQEAIAESRKRPFDYAKKSYLGPKSFAEVCPGSPNLKVHESTPKWLVNYWPKKRVELRREMLAEMGEGSTAGPGVP